MLATIVATLFSAARQNFFALHHPKSRLIGKTQTQPADVVHTTTQQHNNTTTQHDHNNITHNKNGNTTHNKMVIQHTTINMNTTTSHYNNTAHNNIKTQDATTFSRHETT